MNYLQAAIIEGKIPVVIILLSKIYLSAYLKKYIPLYGF